MKAPEEKRRYWSAMIARYERLGLSQSRFAAEVGVGEANFGTGVQAPTGNRGVDTGEVCSADEVRLAPVQVRRLGRSFSGAGGVAQPQASDGHVHQLRAQQLEGAHAFPRGLAHSTGQQSERVGIARRRAGPELCGDRHIRKNFLFVGHEQAGQNLAGLYSLVATCMANDKDPLAYLTDVLGRIGSHPAAKIDDILPHNWNPPA